MPNNIQVKISNKMEPINTSKEFLDRFFVGLEFFGLFFLLASKGIALCSIDN